MTYVPPPQPIQFAAAAYASILEAPFGVAALAPQPPPVAAGGEGPENFVLYDRIAALEPPPSGAMGWIQCSSGGPHLILQLHALPDLGEEPLWDVQHVPASEPLDLEAGDIPSIVVTLGDK